MSKQRFLSLFLLVAAVPVLLAFVMLKSGWYQAGVNNKGIWFEHEVRLLPAIQQQQAHWRLVYLQPQHCDNACLAVEHLMQQIDLALGRKQDQLDLVVLTEDSAMQASHKPQISFIQRSFAGLAAGSLMIVDQQGLALLHYPLPDAPEQLPLLGKDVMADLQKLLKFDRGPT
ncbi:hypothetical protein [Rheinheimera texasensis]|uniref:hypothetical protein n=1 Tax=Rheinheimera texasensis TaxID=306205 RepID=UPI0032B20C02